MQSAWRWYGNLGCRPGPPAPVRVAALTDQVSNDENGEDSPARGMPRQPRAGAAASPWPGSAGRQRSWRCGDRACQAPCRASCGGACRRKLESSVPGCAGLRCASVDRPSRTAVAGVIFWRSRPTAVGQLLISRDLEQLAGQRSHPAALCGRESFLPPGYVARIAQAATETRRVGQRPDVRPQVPATAGRLRVTASAT